MLTSAHIVGSEAAVEVGTAETRKASTSIRVAGGLELGNDLLGREIVGETTAVCLVSGDGSIERLDILNEALGPN